MTLWTDDPTSTIYCSLCGEPYQAHDQRGCPQECAPATRRQTAGLVGTALAVLLVVATMAGCITAWHHGPAITAWLAGLWGSP